MTREVSVDPLALFHILGHIRMKDKKIIEIIRVLLPSLQA